MIESKMRWLISSIGVPVIRSPQLTSMSSRMRAKTVSFVASLIVGTPAQPKYLAGQFTTAPAATYKGETYSAYVQDTLEFIPDWKLTLGVRRDILRSEYFTTTAFSGNFSENSYRAGLSWQPTAAQHYYAGWSDSFSPTADLYQLSGSQYPAERFDAGAGTLGNGNAKLPAKAPQGVDA